MESCSLMGEEDCNNSVVLKDLPEGKKNRKTQKARKSLKVGLVIGDKISIFFQVNKNYLHCFIWDAEKTPKQPGFLLTPWVCWGTCSIYWASLAGNTPKLQLSDLLVTEEEREASTDTAAHRSDACRLATGTWSCLCSLPHPFLHCCNPQFSF